MNKFQVKRESISNDAPSRVVNARVALKLLLNSSAGNIGRFSTAEIFFFLNERVIE